LDKQTVKNNAELLYLHDTIISLRAKWLGRAQLTGRKRFHWQDFSVDEKPCPPTLLKLFRAGLFAVTSQHAYTSNIALCILQLFTAGHLCENQSRIW
jgi:hypothetical protein